MHPPRPSIRSRYVRRQRLDRAAIHYLERCYRTRTPVRAAGFADFLGVTPQHLSRTTTEVTGETLRVFLRQKQLTYAERLLRSSPLTVKEIALRSGFASETTFHRSFRKAYGISPGAFREEKK